MGFFSDIKNKVTGGAATVTVQAPSSVQRGRAIALRVEATAKSNLKIDNVYLLIRAYETAQIRDDDYADGKRRTEIVTGQRISFENKLTVAGAQQLEQGKTYTWECQLEIPSNANPSFNGKMIDHKWEIQAGLDAKGNDPDSGWNQINVV
jgi:hypothetical protein